MNKLSFKLFELFVHQVTRPVALVIRASANQIPQCRSLCIWTSYEAKYWEDRIQEKLELGKDPDYKMIKYNRADREKSRMKNQLREVNNGANILSEFILYGALSAYLINEAYTTEEAVAVNALSGDILTLQGEIDSLRKQLLETQMIEINDYHVPKSIKTVVLDIKEDGGI